VLGAVKNVKVSRAGGRWLVSIQTEREVEAPVHRSATAVGIDMGVVRLATLSEGTFCGPRNSLRQHQPRAGQSAAIPEPEKEVQPELEKSEGSARLHIRVANARRDYLHKASSAISKNHAIVCVEDLRVSNLSSSAAGSRQSPGSQVRAKSGLNRSILDQGWAELRHQLEYKLAWNGVRLIAVRRSIPAGPVRSAGAPVQATARLRLGSAVWNAGVKPPPTWWQQSM